MKVIKVRPEEYDEVYKELQQKYGEDKLCGSCSKDLILVNIEESPE